MTFAVGFIFKDLIPVPSNSQGKEQGAYDPIAHYQAMRPGIEKYLGTWESWKWAILAVAPGIILHEFGHKFVAIAFGLSATYTAAYEFLVLGIVLKLINFPLIFFIPAYTVISGNATALQSVLIAFAGPAVNLVIWLICKFAFNPSKLSKNGQILLAVTQRMNGFLFIFNMLPIPGFDGLTVYLNLIHLFF